VAVIALVTYLVWRFCIKNKRQQYEQEDWAEEMDENDHGEKEAFTMHRDARASTHTVGSIASTVLTRASNIIQIAYIPGVTNRSAPTTPGLLVPPVPPIPIALSNASTPAGYEDQHFFMPGDLRDSTYSSISDRTSYAPRSSVASTIYGKNAVVSPIPAQTVIRGKAAVVSVRSTAGLSSGEQTPPVPSVDFDRFKNGPPSPAFSVGSTFLNSASAATQARPSVIKIAISPGGIKSKTSRGSLLKSDVASTRDSTNMSLIDESSESKPTKQPKKMTSLGDVAEIRGLELKRETSPFGDEHATSE
jgi:hypothetical protein